MKKFTLFFVFAIFGAFSFSTYAQTLNQAASWPNASWTLSGTYTAGGLLSDPTGAGTTLTWDDDAAGNGSADDIQATSPVIDLTAASGAGETDITISGDYVYRALGGDVLQIEVYDADAASWSALETFTGNSTNTDYQTCSGTAAYVSATLDISGYTATQLSGFQYRFTYDDQGGWQWGWCLTSPTITSASAATCFDVSGLTLDSATATSANISWTASVAGETNWEIAVQTDGTGIPGTGDGSGTDTATNPHTASGLSGNTAYEVYVRAECTAGTDFGGWVGPLDFTTPCASIVPDYTADMSTNAPDSGVCWEEAGDGEVAAGPSNIGFSDWQNDNDYGVGPSNEINLFGNTDREWLLSPPFDLSADGYELVVNVGVTDWNSSTNPDTMGSDDEVQLLMSTDGGANWTNLTTWTVADNLQPSGTEYIHDLTGTTGSAVLFAIWASDGTVNDAEDYDFHVGQFVVRTPPACPDVSTIMVSNVTSSGADVAWTAGGTETDWEVAVQTAGTGTPGGSGAMTSSNPYSASGLTADTAYEVYVRSDCGGGDLGNWIGPVDFTTLCDAFAVPFNETFDSTSTTEDCWTVLNVNADADAWDLDYTSDTITGDESAAINTDFNGGANDDWLITPTITLTGNERLVFKYSLQSTGEPNDFEVLLSTTGTAPAAFTNTLLALASYNDVDVDLGQSTELTVDLSAYSGDVNIAWHIPSGGLDGWRLYIDDVLVEEIPPCPDVSDVAVSNISATGADVSWTNGGSETDWEVAVQAQGTGVPGGSGDATTSNPYSASGLTAQTDYEVYVRADCGGGDLSNWVGPVNFTTACNTFALPLFEDFEGNGDAIPDCWSQEYEVDTVDWRFDSDGDNGGTNGTADSAFSGTRNAMFVDSSGADDITKLVSPALDLSGATSPELSFFHAQQEWAGDQDELRVYYRTSAGGAWTLLAEYTSDIVDWTAETLALPSPSADYYIAFEGNAKFGRGVVIDNVLVWDNAPTTFTYTGGAWAPFDPTGVASFDDEVVILDSDVVIPSDLSCNTMTVNPGAGLTVAGGATLTTNAGTFLNSSSTSYSSLILDGSIVGQLVYNRHVNINGTGSTGSNDLISAPLTGQAFNTFAAANPNILTNGAGTLYLFGPFEKNTGQYVNWANTETSTLDPGVGYRTGSTDNGTYTFTGTANNGIVTNTILNQGTNNEEWNLIGNPYPSYMNVQDFLNHDGGSGTNISFFDAPTAGIWGYDGNALNGWTIYNLATTTASTVITPGQGFFVSASGTATVEFTPAMRRTGTSDDFIVGRNAPLTYLTLSLTSNTNAYSTDFYFNANASEGFDRGYDAAVWGDTTPEFAIYSRLIQDDTGNDIALQALKDSDITNVTIPLGVNANQGQQITFSIHESTLPENVKVYLDDTVANTTTLLNATDYIMTPKGDLSGTGRFFLRYEEDALSSIESNVDALDIFTLNDSNELVVSGALAENATLNLFDIQGRLIMSTALDSKLAQNRINVENINAGIYLATVLDSTQDKTKKVIIK